MGRGVMGDGWEGEFFKCSNPIFVFWQLTFFSFDNIGKNFESLYLLKKILETEVVKSDFIVKYVFITGKLPFFQRLKVLMVFCSEA